MRRSASPRLVAPHTNGHGEGPLVDVVGLVGRREHLALVDVVDAERLEDLGLDEVADAGLGHDRDGDGGLDALDHLGVAHARHAAVAADVGRHPLEGHDRARPGVLGDLGLLGVDDVHDHAALQHLGQAPLHPERAGGAGGCRRTWTARTCLHSTGARPSAPCPARVIPRRGRRSGPAADVFTRRKPGGRGPPPWPIGPLEWPPGASRPPRPAVKPAASSMPSTARHVRRPPVRRVVVQLAAGEEGGGGPAGEQHVHLGLEHQHPADDRTDPLERQQRVRAGGRAPRGTARRRRYRRRLRG